MKKPRFLREDLAKFIKDPRTIKEFEDLAFVVSDELPASVDGSDTEIAALNGLVGSLLALHEESQRRIERLESILAAQPVRDYERRLMALEIAVSSTVN